MPIIGTQQSPISINHDDSFFSHFPCSYFEFNGYEPDTIVEGTFTDKNFQFHIPPRGLKYKGSEWYLHRIHFHPLAEHILDSTTPQHHEVHFIHYQNPEPNPSDPKVVLAGFFTTGGSSSKERSSFQQLNIHDEIAQSPSTKKSKKKSNGVNPNHFLPKNISKWYHYQGSLTSGTFSEDVSWFILADTYTVPEKDLKFLQRNASQHHRGYCPLNRRFVLRSFE